LRRHYHGAALWQAGLSPNDRAGPLKCSALRDEA